MVYIDIKKSYTKEDIKKVSNIIENGGVAILPTDTVYGIVADAFNEEAVRKIYEIKERNFSKPCNILVSNENMIKKAVAGLSEKEEKVIKNFFPGALTLIVKKSKDIPSLVTAGLDTVGIRMPKNKFLLELIEEINRPIVATSLNISGEESKINVNYIPSKISSKVDCIVDAGETKVKVPSTIIAIEESAVKIIREGPITKSKIEEGIK